MIVDLPPDLTLAHAGELRDTLLRALDAGEGLELDAARVEQSDAAGLQLLCALCHSATLRGVRLAFREGQPGRVLHGVASRAGFYRHQACAEGCLWLGGH